MLTAYPEPVLRYFAVHDDVATRMIILAAMKAVKHGARVTESAIGPSAGRFQERDAAGGACPLTAVRRATTIAPVRIERGALASEDSR